MNTYWFAQTLNNKHLDDMYDVNTTDRSPIDSRRNAPNLKAIITPVTKTKLYQQICLVNCLQLELPHFRLDVRQVCPTQPNP